MSFDKMIQYKALSHIYGGSNSRIIDAALQSPEQVEKLKMKNVCALITLELADRLEEMCNLLSMSKREFIESAVIEALNKADEILEKEGVFDHFVAMSSAQEPV